MLVPFTVAILSAHCLPGHLVGKLDVLCIHGNLAIFKSLWACRKRSKNVGNWELAYNSNIACFGIYSAKAPVTELICIEDSRELMEATRLRVTALHLSVAKLAFIGAILADNLDVVEVDMAIAQVEDQVSFDKINECVVVDGWLAVAMRALIPVGHDEHGGCRKTKSTW